MPVQRGSGTLPLRLARAAAQVVYLLRNITIDPSTWPANGYNLRSSLIVVGQSNLGVPTW